VTCATATQDNCRATFCTNHRPSIASQCCSGEAPHTSTMSFPDCLRFSTAQTVHAGLVMSTIEHSGRRTPPRLYTRGMAGNHRPEMQECRLRMSRRSCALPGYRHRDCGHESSSPKQQRSESIGRRSARSHSARFCPLVRRSIGFTEKRPTPDTPVAISVARICHSPAASFSARLMTPVATPPSAVN